MPGQGTQGNGRSLAAIEADLIKAEGAYADADARLREAKRDRDAALDTINKHQNEFDEGVAALRNRSISGSRWKPGADQFEEDLIVPEVETLGPDSDNGRLRRAKPVEEGPFVKFKLK